MIELKNLYVQRTIESKRTRTVVTLSVPVGLTVQLGTHSTCDVAGVINGASLTEQNNDNSDVSIMGYSREYVRGRGGVKRLKRSGAKFHSWGCLCFRIKLSCTANCDSGDLTVTLRDIVFRETSGNDLSNQFTVVGYKVKAVRYNSPRRI